jgi:hypothetical protein
MPFASFATTKCKLDGYRGSNAKEQKSWYTGHV